jgi:hypothetical protein
LIEAALKDRSSTAGKVKVWREMIRAKIKVAPIMVRPKPDLPGRWTVHSGAVAVEAA